MKRYTITITEDKGKWLLGICLDDDVVLARINYENYKDVLESIAWVLEGMK